MIYDTEPGPEREAFGFAEAVRTHFGFLEEYGLRPVEEKSTFVRYESPSIFVNVYHGRMSFELGVEIGRMASPGVRLTLFEILAYDNVLEYRESGGFTAISPEGIQQFLPTLADWTKKYTVPFLRDDPNAYSAAQEKRRYFAARYTKAVELRVVRAQAEPAWQRKDFAKVVTLYESIKGDLTEVESRKLAYARKHLIPAPDIPGNRARKNN
ncbi:MAG: hypothetical protein ACRD2Y_12935 [Terriglobales bacterium]